jgi:hypothetical protein
MKVPVSRRALYQRIERALRERGEALRVAKPGQVKMLGRHFIVNERGVARRNVDVLKLAEELKVLEPWQSPPKD